MHGDPAAGVVLALAVVLLTAKAGGELAVRFGQAALLGELLAGVLLGNLDLLRIPYFEAIGADPGVDLFARIGVLVLLFEVGLASTIPEMLAVGRAALTVAVLGVVAPFVLGAGAAAILLPEAGQATHLFIGATLTATSIGITAGVLKDLGRMEAPESRIILGAAVLDDVLGLVLLAAMTGLVAGAATGEGVSLGSLAWIMGKSIGFLVVALAIGSAVTRRVYALASRFQGRGVLLALSLSFCFLLAWAADRIGLATLVGAFAAGLILDRVHYRDFVDKGEHPLEHLLQPITSFLGPVFFVVMGMRTDLAVFADGRAVLLAAVLTAVAVVGKVAAALGAGRGVDRLTVGLGMIPRGEVGLIFANLGLGMVVAGAPVIDASTYAAVVIVVIATTMMTPPLLAWRARRLPSGRADADRGADPPAVGHERVRAVGLDEGQSAVAAVEPEHRG